MAAIRTTMTNIAQLLLVFFLFPIAALICEALSPNSGASGLINFLGQLPFCNTIADLLSQAVSGVSGTDVLQITVWVFLREFPTAIITGLLVHFFVALFDLNCWDVIRSKRGMRAFRPLPILPGFIGIFAAAILINVIGLSGNGMAPFLIEIGVLVLMIIGIRMMISAKMPDFFSIRRVLMWIIDGLYAVILSAYMAAMKVIAEGWISSFGEAVRLVLTMGGIAVVASLLVLWVRSDKTE